MGREDPREYERRTLRRRKDVVPGLVVREVIETIPNEQGMSYIAPSATALQILGMRKPGQDVHELTGNMAITPRDTRLWNVPPEVIGRMQSITDCDAIVGSYVDDPNQHVWGENGCASIFDASICGISNTKRAVSPDQMRNRFGATDYFDAYAPGFGSSYLMQHLVVVQQDY